MSLTVNYIESACKDRFAEPHLGFPEKIFAVLDVWDHHVVLTLSFKLVSFFTFMHCIGACKAIMSNFHCGNLHSCMYRLVYLLAEVKKCDPLPAISHWFSLQDRHPLAGHPWQNENAKNEEWFVGIFDARGTGTIIWLVWQHCTRPCRRRRGGAWERVSPSRSD